MRIPICFTRSRFLFAAALLVAGGLLAGFAGVARPAAAAGDCTVSASDLTVDGDESGLLASVNQYRQSKGLAPLAQSAALTKAAAWMSRDMATRNYAPGKEYEHPDSLGRLIKQRQADCGYLTQPFSQENIYEGYGSGASAAAAFEWWKNSPYGHNEAMLNAQHKYAGVARSCSSASHCFWTLELGAEAGATQGTPQNKGEGAIDFGFCPGCPIIASAISLESSNLSGYFIRHRNALGYITTVTTPLDQADATWRVVPALSGTPGAVSFESVNYPGTYLRHQNFRLKQHPNDSTDLFRKDASFFVRPGLAGGTTTSFEAVNVPGHYICHANYELSIAPNDGSELFRKDASYYQRPPR